MGLAAVDKVLTTKLSEVVGNTVNFFEEIAVIRFGRRA